MRLVFLLFFFLFLKGNVSLKNFSISADRSLKNLKTGLTVFEDNVNISFGDIKMKTQKATFNYLKKTFYTEGLTIISNPSFSVKTKEKVEGDVNKKTYRVGKVEGNFEEWIFLADNFLFDGNVVKLKGANLSPCLDFTNKLNAYYIRNKEIIYDYEKEEAVLKGIWLYLYKVPILYLPYLKLDLSNLGLPFRFSTGYRESWGAYGKLKLKLSDSKDSKTSILLEARSKRGALLGAEYEMKKNTTISDYLIILLMIRKRILILLALKVNISMGDLKVNLTNIYWSGIFLSIKIVINFPSKSQFFQ